MPLPRDPGGNGDAAATLLAEVGALELSADERVTLASDLAAATELAAELHS